MTENKKADKGEPEPERPRKVFREKRGKMGPEPGKKEVPTIIDTLPVPPPRTPKDSDD